MSVTAWVIGAGGLLGSALTRTLTQRAGVQVIHSPSLPWNDAEALRAAVAAQMQRLCEAADAAHGEWQILWAGGAAVTSSPTEAFDREIAQFTIVLDAISGVLRDRHSQRSGVFFFASSAGGVYAGSAAPPPTMRRRRHHCADCGDVEVDA